MIHSFTKDEIEELNRGVEIIRNVLSKECFNENTQVLIKTVKQKL